MPQYVYAVATGKDNIFEPVHQVHVERLENRQVGALTYKRMNSGFGFGLSLSRKGQWVRYPADASESEKRDIVKVLCPRISQEGFQVL